MPKKPLRERKIKDGETPLVSICVLTYNHEEYIEQALDSFFMQVTDFVIEIVLHDDASTDNTVSIIKKYEEKYPGIIKPIYQTVNQRSQLGGGMSPRFNFPRAKGKYIALCEGDDYWTDPLKLQKQVNLLESNSKMIACHHWQKMAIKKGNFFEEVEAPKKGHGYFPFETGVRSIFENKMRVKTRTLMFRNIINPAEILLNFPNAAFGDVPLSFVLGKYGRFDFIDEEMAVYRQTNKGVSTNGLEELGFKKFRIQHFKNWIQIWDYADKYYNFQHHQEAKHTVQKFYKIIIKNLPINLSSFTKVLFYNIFKRKLPSYNKMTSTKWLIFYYLKKMKRIQKNKFLL